MSTCIEQCWFLTGATAVGKTPVGIALAMDLDAEIVSLDSMAIYRGMNIGTAKPTAAERTRVPHHMIDIVDPCDEFSVAQYIDAARRKVTEIRARGKEVLFVGGTPLYLKSLLRGLFSGPPADWELRRQIESEVSKSDGRPLYSLLEKIDPVAAAHIHPNDTRRLVRALEVFRATGEPISHRQLEFDESRPANACRVFALHRDRAEQHRRIETRTEAMFAEGIVDEVRALTSGGQQLSRTASQAVSYREVQDYLAGQLSLEEAKDHVKARTRRFAKRQGTWFRSLSECRFIAVEGEVDAKRTASQIAARGRSITAD